MVLLGIAESIVIDPQTISANRSLRSALAQLADADACARGEQCSPWEFAVEIESLVAAGLTTSDLRWLVKRGYVEHAEEITRVRDTAQIPTVPQSGFCQTDLFRADGRGGPISGRTGSGDASVSSRRAAGASPRNAARRGPSRGVRTVVG